MERGSQGPGSGVNEDPAGAQRAPEPYWFAPRRGRQITPASLPGLWTYNLGLPDQRIVRRSYNYDLGLDQNGDIQAGHVFVAYQQDVRRQFETIQERLINEPLVDYVQPFGGGYFYTMPGVTHAGDWYGRTLLS
jgi:hypothetical protein